jgi:antiviral defense system Shedu protein SduA
VSYGIIGSLKMTTPVSERDIPKEPTLDDTYYEYGAVEKYHSEPKKRFKAVAIAKEKSTGERFIQLIDRWTGHKFGKGKTSVFYWKKKGSNYRIKEVDDIPLLARILRKFGKALGFKVEESAEEENNKLKEEVKQLTEALTETTQRQKELEEFIKRQEIELKLAKKLLGSITDYKKELDLIENEINESKEKNQRKEQDVKKLIVKSKWVLGLDCQVESQEKSVDTQTAIDMHVITGQGENKIFEFKSPNLLPFEKEKEGTRLKLTAHLSEGLNQLITYMRRADIYSELERAGTNKIMRPAGVIVIGYKLEKQQLMNLKDWNFHLRPHIQIITYDTLLKGAKLTLESIKKVHTLKH